MKSVRIGNDIRIEWEIQMQGDVSKLQDLHLSVVVRPSRDQRPPCEEPRRKPLFGIAEREVVMTGGIECDHDRHHQLLNPSDHHIKDLTLPFSIEGNKIIAIWEGRKQIAPGCYDILLYAHKGEGGQGVADQTHFVRLVPHSCMVDEGTADDGIEVVIPLSPVVLQITGLSAYDIAVINGFKGTEKEWLESLKAYEGSIELSELTTFVERDITDFFLGDACGRYKVMHNGLCVGLLDVFVDAMKHSLTQRFMTNEIPTDNVFDGGQHQHTLKEYYRVYNRRSEPIDLPDGSQIGSKSWSMWSEIKDEDDCASITIDEIDELIALTDKGNDREETIMPPSDGFEE